MRVGPAGLATPAPDREAPGARPGSGETTVAGAPGPAPARFPAQRLEHLDTLWIQVAGTLCNLRCTHCFVSCGPGDERHGLMSRVEVAARVAEALALGVREFYFTGGEPFLHPELLAILGDTLASGPATVLTNGTLFTGQRIAGLRRLSDEAAYSLEVRVSLDGASGEEHDRFRGAGSYARVVAGLRQLDAAGLLPIVTVTQDRDQDPLAFRACWVEALRAEGLARVRLKILPLFRLGREVSRTRGYAAAETLAGLPEEHLAAAALQCASGRAVTSRGVFVCPLLVDEPGGRMDDTLAGALHPFPLAHAACFTCWTTGMTCGNPA